MCTVFSGKNDLMKLKLKPYVKYHSGFTLIYTETQKSAS